MNRRCRLHITAFVFSAIITAGLGGVWIYLSRVLGIPQVAVVVLSFVVGNILSASAYLWVEDRCRT